MMEIINKLFLPRVSRKMKYSMCDKRLYVCSLGNQLCRYANNTFENMFLLYSLNIQDERNDYFFQLYNFKPG